MPHNLPAVDARPRVRLWDRKFNQLAERRMEDGQTGRDVIVKLLQEHGLHEANATIDWPTGDRWSGFVELIDNRFEYIDHREVMKMTEWPEFMSTD